MNNPVIENVTDLAEPQVIERSQAYVSKMQIVQRSESNAHTQVRGSQTYAQTLSWDQNGFLKNYSCSCPHYAAGNFCKHLVAAVIALIEQDADVDADTQSSGAGSAKKACKNSASNYVNTYLDRLNAAQLRDLVHNLMDCYPEAAVNIEHTAAFHYAPEETIEEMLSAEYKDTFRSRGFLDWRAADDAAWEIEDFLHLLNSCVQEGYATIVEPVLKRTVKRIQNLMLRADDSNGVLGDSCQTALDMYAEVAAQAQVNPAKLAKWLVKMRIDSPGWPDITLAPFVPALGDAGINVFRKAVETEAVKLPSDASPYGAAFEIFRMRLELADYEDDIDTAVQILSTGEHIYYSGIVDRLLKVQRIREAIQWVDRAITAKRYSFAAHTQNNDSFLYGPDIIELYATEGYAEDAAEFAWNSYREKPELEVAQALYSFLMKQDVWERESSAFWQVIEEYPWRSGSEPIRIALALKELERAWDYAQRWGAGWNWEELALAKPYLYPDLSLELYFASFDEDFALTGTKSAKRVVAKLRAMRKFIDEFDELKKIETQSSLETKSKAKHEARLASTATAEFKAQHPISKAQLETQFAEYISHIRQERANRPVLMKALNKAGF